MPPVTTPKPKFGQPSATPAPQATPEPVKTATPQTQPTPTPIAETKPVETTPTEVKTSADILKRVASEPAKPTLNLEGEQVFSSADLKAHLETIQDPMQRKMFEDVYKNMEKGVQKKFQKIADLERQLKESSQWTPDRLQKEIYKPDFINASQQIIQSQQQTVPPQTYAGTASDWSALTPQEQQTMRQTEAEVSRLRQAHAQLAGTLEVEKADLDIRNRIPNYDPNRVNQLQEELRQGTWNINRIRESLWKADNFDKIMEQTYQMGLNDRSESLREKMSASTLTGGNSMAQPVPQPQNTNESRSKYFARIALEKLSQLKQGIR